DEIADEEERTGRDRRGDTAEPPLHQQNDDRDGDEGVLREQARGESGGDLVIVEQRHADAEERPVDERPAGGERERGSGHDRNREESVPRAALNQDGGGDGGDQMQQMRRDAAAERAERRQKRQIG